MPVGSFLLGSMFYAGRGKLGDSAPNKNGVRRSHFDGIECYSFLMPICPAHAVHVWDWQRNSSEWSWTKRVEHYSYRAMPIRWSNELVYRTILRFWLWLPCIVSQFYVVGERQPFLVRAFAFFLFAASAGGLIYLFRMDKRDRRIRQLLGRHQLGYSDPAHWTDELLQLAAPAEQWFGTSTFREAANVFLKQGRPREAIWAARLCAALEDAGLGNDLTDRILERHESGSAIENPGWPLFSGDDSEAARFWRSLVFGRSMARYTSTTYANHVGGAIAQAFETEDDADDEAELDGQQMLLRPDPASGKFMVKGLSMVAALILATLSLPFATQAIERVDRLRQHRAHVKQIEAGRKAQDEKRRQDEQQRQQHAAATATHAKSIKSFVTSVKTKKRTYLTELPLKQTLPGPWPVSTKGTTGERNHAISVHGVASPRGIGMHPPGKGFASATFAIPPNFVKLITVAAIDDSSLGGRDSAVFEVWGDGRRLWRSRPLRARAEFDSCQIDVGGVRELELRVVAAGDYWGLHAVWLEPVLAKE